MPPSPGDNERTQRLLKLLFRTGVSALIVGILVYKISWVALGRVIAEMHIGLTLAAFILLHVGQSFSSWRWMILARPLGFTEPYSRYRTLFYVGTFFNLFLPTSIGGDAVRALMLAQHKNRRLPAFGSVIADRVSGVTAMLLMACLATLAPMGNAPWWVPVLPWLILGGLFLTMALLPRLAGYSSKFKTLLFGMGWEDGRRNTWWKAVGISFIVQGLATLQVILLSIAMTLPVPWHAYLVVVPLVTLLTMLPLTVNGMGVREGSLILLLSSYGVTDEQAFALGLGWFALSLGVGLIGGLLYLFSDRSSEPVLHDIYEQGKESHEHFDRRSHDERTGQRQAAA